VNWYNNLTSKDNLKWNLGNDLCGQNGVTCDNSSPQRVIKLYTLFFFDFFEPKIFSKRKLILLNYK